MSIRRAITAPARGYRHLAGTGVTVGLVLALVTGAAVFALAAGPRQNQITQTRALARDLAAAPALDRTVGGYANWADLRGLFGAGLATDQVTGPANEVAGQLTGTLAPAAAGSWSGMATGGADLSTALLTDDAIKTIGLRTELVYRDTLRQHSRLVAGAWPDQANVTATSAGFQVAITQAMAKRAGLGIGSRVPMRLGSLSGTATIVGIIAPGDTADGFWTYDPAITAPFEVFEPGQPTFWMSGLLIGPNEVAPLQQAEAGSQEMQVQFGVPLDLSKLDSASAQTEIDQLAAVKNSVQNVPLAGDTTYTINLTSGPTGDLEQFISQRQAVETVMALLFASLLALVLGIILVCGHLLDERRTDELALLRARGASLPQLARLAALGAVTAIPAAAVGLVGALAVTGSYHAARSWWPAPAAATLAAVLMPAASALRHRKNRFLTARDREEPLSRQARTRRTTAALVAVIGSVGSIAVLRQYGTSQGDLLIDLAPLLSALPIAIAISYLIPRLVRGLAVVAARRDGAVPFLALARASRSRSSSILTSFALILGLGVVALGASMPGLIRSGEVQSSWASTGVDASIDASYDDAGVLNPGVMRELLKTPGVTSDAAVYLDHEPDYLTMQFPYTVVFADPAAYAALTSGTPGPQLPTGLPEKNTGGTVIPAIYSTALSAQVGTGVSQLSIYSGFLQVHPVGTVATTAADPNAGDKFVILPSWAEELTGTAPPVPNELLIRGADLNGSVLTATAARELPLDPVTVRSTVLAALADAPVQSSSFGLMALILAAALGCCAAILLAGLSLGARSRAVTLARLATMGLNRRQSNLLITLEQMPALVGALVGGSVCALLLVRVIAPGLDLTGFTGAGAVNASIRISPVALLGAAAAIVLLTVLTLVGHTAAAHRRGITAALRVGE